MPRMTIEQIACTANDAYRDSHILRQFAGGYVTNFGSLPPTEALAAFIVKLIIDLYDPASNDKQNLLRITTGLGHAAHQLQDVEKVLNRLRNQSGACTWFSHPSGLASS